MDRRGNSKASSQRSKRRVDGNSREGSQIPESQLPYQNLPPQSQNQFYQNQTPHQQTYSQNPIQHPQQNYYQDPYLQNYSSGYGFQNQNQQQNEAPYYVPDTSHIQENECYFPDTSHIRETQLETSDEEEPENNEDEDESSDETPPQPQQKPKRNYTKRVKPQKWIEEEEVALTKAYIDCSADKRRGNQKTRSAFWEDILEHFCTQLRGSDRSKDQVHSKWKDLQRKINNFNCIYNRLKNRRTSGRSDVDILKAARSEYLKLNKKVFPHEAAWDFLHLNDKWKVVELVGTYEPHSSSKRSKTFASGEPTSGSDARFSAGTAEEVDIEREEEEEDEIPHTTRSRQRKGNQPQTEQANQTAILQRDAEARQHFRMEKLSFLIDTETKKSKILEHELFMIKSKRYEKDMQYFLKPTDHMTGQELTLTLSHKQKIAEYHGWTM